MCNHRVCLFVPSLLKPIVLEVLRVHWTSVSVCVCVAFFFINDTVKKIEYYLEFIHVLIQEITHSIDFGWSHGGGVWSSSAWHS